MKDNRKFNVLKIVGLVFAIAGVIVSATLIKEDVLSTKLTLVNYFPARFGVTPASTEGGATTLGIFTTILQVISAYTAGNKKLPLSSRIMGIILFIASAVFDNWTDVVFRSGYLKGDIKVAIITTLAFYTGGSEITQALSWVVIGNTWREAISEAMWLFANVSAGISTIGKEFQNIKRHAGERENRERGVGTTNNTYVNHRKVGNNKNNNYVSQAHNTTSAIETFKRNLENRGSWGDNA